MTRLDTAGSTLFKLTWKGRTTPLGRRYLQRRALALHTRGKGFTSWPTPKGPKFSHDAKFFREVGRTEPTDLETAALMCGWDTPIANDAEKRGVPSPEGAGLAGSVHLASWTTPTAHDVTARGKGQKAKHGTTHGCADLNRDVALAAWTTPSATDGERGGKMTPEMSGSSLGQLSAMTTWPTPTGEDSQCAGSRAKGSATLNSATKHCGWASPTARDWKDSAGMAKTGINPDGSVRNRTEQLGRQVSLTVSGETRIGYSATDGIVTIGNGAQLNPEHSRWLQGLPIEFSNCADTAMQSYRKSRRRSSKPPSKRKG